MKTLNELGLVLQVTATLHQSVEQESTLIYWLLPEWNISKMVN